MRGTNSKNEKSQPKNNFFAAERGWNGAEKLIPLKGTSGAPTKFTNLINLMSGS